ncbi:MAG: ATP-binding protein [Thiohalorhabdus sp.]
MADEESPSDKGNSLRQRARERLGARGTDVSVMSLEDTQALVEELQVHQEELAIQNEELQEIREALERARDRYRDLFQQAPVGYLILDNHGHILEANWQATELLGVSRGVVEERPFSEYIAADSQDAWFLHRRALAREGGRQATELVLAPAGDQRRVVRVETVPEAGADPDQLRYRSALIDITESKQDEEALLEGERRKDEFLSLLGHELSNPLTPITSLSEHLLNYWDQLDAERIREAVLIIRQQSHHLARMVEELLDLSRVKQGRLILRKTEVDAREIARQALDAVSPRLEEQQQGLQVELPEFPLTTFADPTRLEQILSNLLRNACKFTPAGGTIRLSGTREGEWVVLSVSDTGKGIPPEHLSGIFDDVGQKPYQDPNSGGLGLGLSLVRRLVELHEGRVEARSPGEGQGATFLVCLPAA